MLMERDLVGAWRLVSHCYLNEDGSTDEGPLGAGADGLLIYHPSGFMAASLMRTDSWSGDAPAPYLGSVESYLGYSGRWRVEKDAVVHQVVIGSHRRVVNTEQVRGARLTNGLLTLRNRLPDSTRHVVMDWRRA